MLKHYFMKNFEHLSEMIPVLDRIEQAFFMPEMHA